MKARYLLGCLRIFQAGQRTLQTKPCSSKTHMRKIFGEEEHITKPQRKFDVGYILRGNLMAEGRRVWSGCVQAERSRVGLPAPRRSYKNTSVSSG